MMKKGENQILLDKYKYLRTKHPYHLVDPSPWPFTASVGALVFTTGAVKYMHGYLYGWSTLILGVCILLFTMTVWWRDVIREATFENRHNAKVQKGLRIGMVLFLLSEAMFFFAFFWAFFYSAVSATSAVGGVWPPHAIGLIAAKGIPLTNTCLLVFSGASVTWAHHAVLNRSKSLAISGLLVTLLFAALFTTIQGVEYVNAPFSISDGIYGSCFYMLTGLHGFHVLVGSIALLVALARLSLNHFTREQHFGLEAAIWYWHFVDVVWLLLYASVYWWGNK